MSIISGFFGDPKRGKTDQTQMFPEGILCIDGEYPRAEQHWKACRADRWVEFLPGRVIYQKSEKGHKRGQLDVIGTMNVLESSVNRVLDVMDQYETIVLDGASDIRTWIAAKWLWDWNEENRRIAKSNNKPFKERCSIGKDLHAWTEINDKTANDIIFPLINACRMADKNFVLTATMKDEYTTIIKANGEKDSVSTGERLPDIKDWVRHELDVLCTLSYKSHSQKYWVTVDSSTTGHFEQDITGLSLYGVLIERGIT